MHYHGAYYSNYHTWLKDSTRITPSSHLVWSLIGQESINTLTNSICINPACDTFYTGIQITAGFFHVWHSTDIYSTLHLQDTCITSMISTIIYIHIAIYSPNSHLSHVYTPTIHHLHLLAIMGSSSITWYAHQSHISLPSYSMNTTHSVSHLLTRIEPLSNYASTYTQVYIISCSCLHHLSLGLISIIPTLSSYHILTQSFHNHVDFLQHTLIPWHSQLSICLAILGSLSIASTHYILLCLYPYLISSYPTCLSIFCHHQWIGSLLILGSSAHTSIQLVQTPYPLTSILQHHHTIITHLIWLNISLSSHSLALYVHNDTCDTLSRAEDIFHDNSTRLHPSINILASSYPMYGSTPLYTSSSQSLGTADFLVSHIHAFSLHLTVLIIFKAILHPRTSRLISDKLDLGFHYPCDGPARGGTCQISPWDHLFLALLWMYNLTNIMIFHYFWKMQSDVWEVHTSSIQPSYSIHINHLTSSDYYIHSITINGWLRNYLWSERTQVIQSYGRDAISAYTFIFIASHFIWSFSLMFLYSGRAYWQELVESIIWSHTKIKITPHIQPRALNITQGRAVGCTHFLLGGIGCTWSSLLSRILVLTI